MYPIIQDVAKFRSKCAKYKMDFYPELFGLKPKCFGVTTMYISQKKIPVHVIFQIELLNVCDEFLWAHFPTVLGEDDNFNEIY